MPIRHAVHKYLSQLFREIDKPSIIGLRVALLLWPPNWFEDHFIPPIRISKFSNRRERVASRERTKVSGGEQKLFAGKNKACIFLSIN